MTKPGASATGSSEHFRGMSQGRCRSGSRAASGLTGRLWFWGSPVQIRSLTPLVRPGIRLRGGFPAFSVSPARKGTEEGGRPEGRVRGRVEGRCGSSRAGCCACASTFSGGTGRFATKRDHADAGGGVFDWTDSWEDDRNSLRVLRGGAWNGSVTGVRCSNRNAGHPATRNVYNGFRCARGL